MGESSAGEAGGRMSPANVGGLEATSGAGGEAGQPPAPVDTAGAGGEAGQREAPALPDDERFRVLVAPAPPSELVTAKGPNRTRIPLSTTDRVTSYAEQLWVSHDGAVIIGTWVYAVHRPSTGSAFAPQRRAFRWTEGGMVSLVSDPEAVHSVPMGMSGDGSVVFAMFETFDGTEHLCRWTEAEGCQPLPALPGLTEIYEKICSAGLQRSYCVSDDGEHFVVEATDDPLDLSPSVARWSGASWHVLPEQSLRWVHDDGSALTFHVSTPAFWPLDAEPQPLAKNCMPIFDRSGSLPVTICTSLGAADPQSFRFPTPETPVLLGDEFAANNINIDGTVVVGHAPVRIEGTRFEAAARWTEATSLQPVFVPELSTDWLSSVQVSDDGQVVFGNVSQDATHGYPFRWSEATGSHVLEPPSGFDQAAISLANRDGSVLAGYSYMDGDFDVDATLWRGEEAPLVVSQVVEQLGIDLAGFEPATVSYIAADEPLRAIGMGRLPPTKDGGQVGRLAGGVWVARLP